MSSSRKVFLAEVVLQEMVLSEVVLREAVLQKPWHSKKRFLTVRAPNPEDATPTFSTRIENQDHADGHNEHPGESGGQSNSLWWALNGVSLLFACSKCGTTVRESPYTDMILLRP